MCFRRSLWRICSTGGAAVATVAPPLSRPQYDETTLSGKIQGLVEKALMEPNQSVTTTSAAIWEEVDAIASMAIGVREVDSFLSCVGELLRQQSEESSEVVKPTPELWMKLFKTTRYSGIESWATTHFVKVPETVKGDLKPQLPGEHRPTHLQTFYPELSRMGPDGRTHEEKVHAALYHTQGVIPLSLRVQRSDGSSTRQLLALYLDSLAGALPRKDVVKSMFESLLSTAETLSMEEMKLIYFQLSDAEAKFSSSDTARGLSSEEDIDPEWRDTFFELLGKCDGSRKLKLGQLDGACLTLELIADGELIPPVQVFETVLKRILNSYAFVDVLDDSSVDLRRLIVNAQRRYNDQIALFDEDSREQIAKCNQLVDIARLRVALFERDKAAFEALFESITSTVPEEAQTISWRTTMTYHVVQYFLELMGSVEGAVEKLRELVAGFPKGALPSKEDAVVLQDTHKLVVKALCASGDPEKVNTAYSLLLVHKYHGLKVDAELVKLFAPTLAEKGDCRFFNLVDVCTMFCGNRVDAEIIAHMFRTCAVAGDHHRAAALYRILKEEFAGFLYKLSPKVIDDLRYLEVLPKAPTHFFDRSLDVPSHLEFNPTNFKQLHPIPTPNAVNASSSSSAATDEKQQSSGASERTGSSSATGKSDSSRGGRRDDRGRGRGRGRGGSSASRGGSSSHSRGGGNQQRR